MMPRVYSVLASEYVYARDPEPEPMRQAQKKPPAKKEKSPVELELEGERTKRGELETNLNKEKESRIRLETELASVKEAQSRSDTLLEQTRTEGAENRAAFTQALAERPSAPPERSNPPDNTPMLQRILEAVSFSRKPTTAPAAVPAQEPIEWDIQVIRDAAGAARSMRARPIYKE
jgi:hypothetical protein